MTKKVLIAAIQHWHSPYQVGTHAIAKQFLKRGWEVAYISAPITPFHLLRRADEDLKQRVSNYRTGGEHDYDGKLWHYVPFSFIAPDNRPILSSQFVLEKWFRFSAPNLINKTNSNDFSNPDLLFIDSYYQSFWLDNIEYQNSAYRVADKNSGFEGYSDSASAVEKHIIQKVNRVFIASESMRKWMIKLNPRSLAVLPNGVDLERFIGPMPKKPQEYLELSQPIAIYVGAFGPWFDFELIRNAAEQKPNIEFILIGVKNDSVLKLAKAKNIHFLGPKNSSQIAAYLRHATFGLIPFDAQNHSDLVNHINPLKLYEYLACDLKVVSTRWQALERLNLPIHLASDAETFIKYLRPQNSEKPNSGDTRSELDKISWENTLSILFDWLA